MNSAFYEWRDAVASPQGPSKPVTRHLLLTVALFMDPDGGGAYPSYELLAERTGLSKRSITAHMKLAVSEGWLTRKVRGRNGQGWRLYEYSIALPPAVAESCGRVAGDSTRTPKGGAYRSKREANWNKKVEKDAPLISPLDLSIDLLPRTTYERPTLGKTDVQLSEARETLKALKEQAGAKLCRTQA